MQQKIAFQKNQKSCWQPLKVMINYTSCRWNDNNKQKRILKSCWQTKKIMINYSGCRKTTEILEKEK